ncbi:MAG: ABC transporter permease subunit [Planctomycetaceae bacterium]|nr:ABC transporter permease subunit [Planctomycetaceae bacterium]
MLQRTFALVQRSLRVDCRDIRPHLFRMGLPAIFIITLMLMQADRQLQSAPGRDLMGWLALYDYIFVTFAAATFFATAIVEEREQQTLGLLRMAGVGPLTLLGGKWLPRMWSGILLLVVQIPFTMLCITLGGVMWHQVYAMFVCLLAYLLMVGGIALLCSVLSRSISAACGWTTAIIVLLHVGVWMIAYTFSWGPRGWKMDWLAEFLGANRLFTIFEVSFAESAWSYQVWTNLAVGAILIGASVLAFHLLQDRQDDEAGRGLLATLTGDSRTRKHHNRAWASAPLFWQGMQQVAGGPIFLVGRMFFHLFVVMVLLAWMSSFRNRIDEDEIAGVMIAWGIFAFVLEGAYLAAQVFRIEIANQTWSTLCMLPKSLSEIVYPRLGGASLALLPTASLVAMGILIELRDFVRALDDDEFWLVLFFFSSLIALGWHLTTLFSITIDWSAWPISIFLATVVVILGGFFSIFMVDAMTSGNEEPFVWFLGFCNWMLVAVIHAVILERLRARLGA